MRSKKSLLWKNKEGLVQILCMPPKTGVDDKLRENVCESKGARLCAWFSFYQK